MNLRNEKLESFAHETQRKTRNLIPEKNFYVRLRVSWADFSIVFFILEFQDQRYESLA